MVKVMGREAGALLNNVPDEYVFYLNDGRILRNMEELKDALKSMSDELYAYPVNAEKNDFSNWVRDIICDEKLARDLLKSKDRIQSYRVVAQRIAFLKPKGR